jgi:hypothetical protein
VIFQRESGLLVALEKPTPPPEHSVRQVIRDAMAKLAEELGNFEQTTHCVIGDGSIRSVADALRDCYDDPRAYTISDLNQLIDQFLAKAGGLK